MRPKHIICLIENLGSGGAERQLSGLAVLLHQQGHDVEVWYYVDKDFYVPYLKENGVVSRYMPELRDSIKRFFTLHKQLRKAAPDTVISYSASPSMICSALKMVGAKYNLIVSERNTTQSITRREKLLFYLYRWADYIVPNSHAQGRFLSSYSPKLAPKINVITNFVDTTRFSPTKDLVIISPTTRVVCVGRLFEQKNIPTFIEAVAKVAQDGYSFHVDWFGKDYGDAYAAKCHEAHARCQMENYFTFHEPQTDIEVQYRNHDVFFLPSIYEGYPNVLCEAMSCGLPVMGSRVSDVPDLIAEGENGFLFDPKDVDDMARNVERMLDLTPEERLRMGEKSREIAVERFSKEKFLQKYLEII